MQPRSGHGLAGAQVQEQPSIGRPPLHAAIEVEALDALVAGKADREAAGTPLAEQALAQLASVATALGPGSSDPIRQIGEAGDCVDRARIVRSSTLRDRMILRASASIGSTPRPTSTAPTTLPATADKLGPTAARSASSATTSAGTRIVTNRSWYARNSGRRLVKRQASTPNELLETADDETNRRRGAMAGCFVMWLAFFKTGAGRVSGRARRSSHHRHDSDPERGPNPVVRPRRLDRRVRPLASGSCSGCRPTWPDRRAAPR